MEPFIRKAPHFSLCGLNCCLCPRFNTEGKSKCPGCGGVDFAEQHPTCAVATCNRKHDGVEYCFLCGQYPCAKYETESACDSFISYRSVKENFKEAKADLAQFKKTLARRFWILQTLLSRFNDGKSKGIYCLISNDMPIEDLELVVELAEKLPQEMDIKEKAKLIKKEIEKIEIKLGVEYKLRNAKT